MSLCPTCGADPCVNPSFCAACRDADQRKARGEQPRHIDASMWNKRPDPIRHDWESTSVDALWHLFNSQRQTPQTTMEAIIHCVRARGVAALKEPANLERLKSCDAAARTEINRRIARLIAAKDIAA
jgi:hypothetical protein